MKEQGESSPRTGATTPDGQRAEELKLKYLTYSKALKLNPNQEDAKFFLYGEAPEETWEMPLPEWVNRLPKTAPLSKQAREVLSRSPQ
jgi:hypothetical protein